MQVLSYNYIVEAVKKAVERTGVNLFIIGTLMPEDQEESLELLTSIDCKIALVHGALTIPHYLRKVGEHLELVEGAGLVPGGCPTRYIGFKHYPKRVSPDKSCNGSDKRKGDFYGR